MSDVERDIDVFERLRASWLSHRSPIVDHLRAGLTTEELDAVEASSGLVLPVEMRLWWGWHNGVEPDVPGTRLGAGPWDLLSLADALKYRARLITLTEEFEEDDEVRWLPEWLPVVRYDSSYLFVTCGEPRTGHSEVRRWDDVPDDPYTVQSPSWTAAVTVFAEQLESGDYTYSTEESRWYGPARRPAGVARLL
ncbi:SMI1/KNR4 family protein [Paractinoplanes maris]|uniref:SMI1/KNR4 family protein n=1 Tax=Paractinoplanes maris TaxID=1734446 RepID=UPI00201FB532|nr:SMI1/KNR4 family protein [Actinoplanes maris]